MRKKRDNTGFHWRSKLAIVTILTALPVHVFSQNVLAPNPAQAAIDKVVLIKSVVIKPPNPASQTTDSISVELQNISKQAIYAIKLRGVLTWPDGSSESVVMGPIDWLVTYVQDDIAPMGTYPPTFVKPPIFRPGETRPLFGRASIKNGAAPISAVYTVSMIALADRTALGKHEDIQQLLGMRAIQLDQYTELLASLQLVFQADDPVKAAEARAKELRAPRPGDPNTYANGKRQSPNEAKAGWLLSFVNSIGAEDKKPGIALLITQHKSLVEITKQHCTLQEVTK